MFITEPEIFRENVRKKINVFLNNEKKTINIERSIYNYSIHKAIKNKTLQKWNNNLFVIIYLDKLKMILCFIKKTYYLDKLLNDEIQTSKIAFMSYSDLYPDKWEKLIEDKKLR